MPGSRRERAAVPALALRLQAAAQLPTPTTPSAEPPPMLARVLGERYPSGGGERPAPIPLDAPPYYRRADAQEAPGEPPAWSLPPEVEEQLRRPFTSVLEPTEEMWAEARTRLMCELLASAGFNALNTRTAQECRAMAYALLTGRELAS